MPLCSPRMRLNEDTDTARRRLSDLWVDGELALSCAHASRLSRMIAAVDKERLATPAEF